MRKIVAFLLAINLASTALAASGTTYTVNPEAFVSSGGTASGSSYSTSQAIDANASGVASGSNYSTEFGVIAASATTSTTTTSTTTVTTTSTNATTTTTTTTTTTSTSTTTTTTIQGTALNNPNPFNPNNGPTKIDYYLDNNAEVDVYLFDATGQLIYKQHYASGSSGGTVGYNSVPWDGISSFNQVVENGLYFLRIVANGQVVAKGKVAVIK